MNSENIIFTHAQHGQATISHGKSSISEIIILSAMSLTAKEEITNDEFIVKYATDAEGIKTLQQKSGGFVQAMQEAIQALSIIMTTTDEQEYGGELNTLSWLVCGLSELAHHVNYHQGLLTDAVPLVNKKSEVKK